ncbi:DUF2867 domain-containing protein [Nguyenibacter vanlangensis]|uniref:DUF2867 domain-containing protein n=1 Tax=Nguyenibacter vanlangensis TaxID=1216886 RepID=A0ABZ3D573_9PROT
MPRAAGDRAMPGFCPVPSRCPSIEAAGEPAGARVRQVGLPSASRLRSTYARADFADAFSVDLPDAASHDVEVLARHVFAQPAAWVAMLLRVRDGLVRPFGIRSTAGLRAGGGDRINFFRVYARHDGEIIIGEDDAHLDFRVSLLVQPASQGQPRRLTVTTLVFYNRLLGRAYIALILPFHRRVVRDSLDRARQRGWPAR